jgi:hypothetical protein
LLKLAVGGGSLFERKTCRDLCHQALLLYRLDEGFGGPLLVDDLFEVVISGSPGNSQ